MMQDRITKEEYDRLFARDENECYINLIIPAINDYPEMNLIGKKPEDYTIDEIVHSKRYRQSMYNKMIETEKNKEETPAGESSNNNTDNNSIPPIS